jgi:hypothetical protein
MFIQVLRGHVADASATRTALDAWHAAPWPAGYLGMTSGVAEDGTFIAVARFASAEAARANSWDGTATLLGIMPTVYDCPIVDDYMGGARDDAGFVQVEVYTGATDVDGLRVVDREFEAFADLRPDLLGVTTAISEDGHAFAANYFSSEEAARAAEAREWPAEVLALVERVAELTDGVEYIDLRTPWMYSRS